VENVALLSAFSGLWVPTLREGPCSAQHILDVPKPAWVPVCVWSIGLCVCGLSVCMYVDVNECSDADADADESESGPCVNARCVNTPGSYRCECTQPGTTLDSTGTTCTGQRLYYDYQFFRVGPGCRIDHALRLLAEWRKRRLNQAFSFVLI